jgi:hypothetical protein
MNTPRRLLVQSRYRCMDCSRFVGADEVDAGLMRHSGREVIERPGGFRLWRTFSGPANDVGLGGKARQAQRAPQG